MLDEHDQLVVIRGLRDGNREAWSALYRGYSADVWRYVARLVGPQSADVADVVQETLLAAARSARQFDVSKGTLWSWLAGIAHRQAALANRRAHRATRVVALAESGAAVFRTLCETDLAVDAIWERQELVEIVRWLLAEMSPEYAGLLTGKYLDEASIEDLSQQWGGSIEATKSKLARARREFREQFERVTRTSLSAADP
ncbi:MAG: sigma-70 family RNA polymerase sigma factor [Planctomycetaceae bacterium]|nr:sigma-70 family RNA polymerase sigma factor [Planctomycetaceae bacterium]